MAAAVIPVPIQRIFDADGLPAVGWKLATYTAGLSPTPVALFADSDLVVNRDNPMVTDAQGYLPQAYAPIDVVLKYVLSDDNDVEQWTADNVPAVEPASVPLPAGVAPSIITQPADQSLSAGDSATVLVVATGTAPLSYQWYLGTAGDQSTPIDGAIGAAYSTLPLASGSYSGWVLVANAYGSASSLTVTLTVT